MQKNGSIYEYTSAINPEVPQVPIKIFHNFNHNQNKTQIVQFDLSKDLKTSYPATSPNLLSNFIEILSNENIITTSNATSNVFYVIRGKGITSTYDFNVEWSKGDLFVIPCSSTPLKHYACEHSSIYWVNDSPLLNYLGVIPDISKFNPTIFKNELLQRAIKVVSNQSDSKHKNRMGILLGNKITENNTKSLTHVLWSLLNKINPQSIQSPHKHNSVALDLCIYAPSDGVYTLIGKELDNHGEIINPTKCKWESGSVFTTPPGLWHSHHNESDEIAWILPIQDAGLYIYQGTLDIKFG